MSLTLCLHASAAEPRVYLLDPLHVLAKASGGGDPIKGPTLEEMTLSAMASIDAAIADISRIVVDVGPGRLSAVRAAVSFANALAFARGLPIAPIVASAAAGHQAEQATGRPAVVVHKSAAGTAYVARYRGKLETLRHGPLVETLKAASSALDAFALVGLPPDAAPAGLAVDGGDGSITGATFLALMDAAEYGREPVQPITEQSDLIDG